MKEYVIMDTEFNSTSNQQSEFETVCTLQISSTDSFHHQINLISFTSLGQVTCDTATI